MSSDHNDPNQVLAKALNLAVTDGGRVAGVQSAMPSSWSVHFEEYCPDIEGRGQRDTVADFALPPAHFLTASWCILPTHTLDRLHKEYPQGRFKVPRFRPNLVVESGGKDNNFPEDAWIGHTLAIGDEV